jgi:hypothetical protein
VAGVPPKIHPDKQAKSLTLSTPMYEGDEQQPILPSSINVDRSNTRTPSSSSVRHRQSRPSTVRPFRHPSSASPTTSYTAQSSQKIYSSGTSTDPSSIPSITSWGCLPSTVHPTDCAVPRISLTVPARFLARDLWAIFRATCDSKPNPHQHTHAHQPTLYGSKP